MDNTFIGNNMTINHTGAVDGDCLFNQTALVDILQEQIISNISKTITS